MSCGRGPQGIQLRLSSRKSARSLRDHDRRWINLHGSEHSRRIRDLLTTVLAFDRARHRICVETNGGLFKRLNLLSDKLIVNNRSADSHITEEDRESYLLNRLPTTEKNRLRQHCAFCLKCFSALEADDNFLNALRIASSDFVPTGRPKSQRRIPRR